MPTNKDLKRLTRSRMAKTGESYTTARAQLLKKRDETAAAEPVNYAELAGMSDAAVEKATGRDWPQWVEALDAADAREMPHREIAQHVHQTWDIPGWWAQTVAVGYERVKGLREIGQRRSGSYEANKSKTLPVAVDELYRAFSDEGTRDRWMPGVEMTIRKQTQDKSMRITWADETSVEIYFWAKGEAKSQVQIQHRKLASKAAAEAVKEFWAERLAALTKILVPA